MKDQNASGALGPGKASRRPEKPSAGCGARYLRLLLGLVGIWLFMFHLIPALDDLPGIKTVIDRNKEFGIKATALFYSDIEETIDATNYMRNQIRYRPAL